MTAIPFKSAGPPSLARVLPRVPRAGRSDRWWLLGFVIAGVGFQVGLYQLGNTPLRMPLRIGVFALSLALGFLPRRRHPSASHPAAGLVQAVAVVLALGVFMPGGAGLMAGVAQATLYLAVLAPLVWVPRLRVDRATFRWVVVVLWAFHATSAFVGALQVRYPGGPFDGVLASTISAYDEGRLVISTSSGDHILRPLGLTDTPGGAGSSGVYAIILGLGLLLTERSLAFRAVVVASMGVSVFSIYLSQGRTNLVIVGVAVVALLAVLVRRGDRGRATALAVVLAGVVVVGTTLAFAAGGDATTDRWATLVADDPTTVAYQNRGQFLDQLIYVDIYKYPFGAGSGRWGMMTYYFGDPSKSLWAEMAWQALLYDGGLPLIGLYIGILGLLLTVAWRTAVGNADPDLACWGAVLVGLNLSTVVASFVFPIYIKDVALQTMTLNACLVAVAGRPKPTGNPAGGNRPARSADRPVALTTPPAPLPTPATTSA